VTTRDDSGIVPTHLRATRRSWIFLIVVAVAAWAIIEGAFTLARVDRAVVPGVYLSRRARVDVPLPRAAADAGVRLRDRIIAVDGEPVAGAMALAERFEGTPVGVPVDVAFDHDGQIQHASLVTIAPSIIVASVRYACGVAFVLIGLAVFWFRPGGRVTWPFMFASVAYGLTVLFLFGHPRTTQSVLDARIGLFAYPLIGPVFVHLFAVFPRPLRALVRRPWLVLVVDAMGLVVGIGFAVGLTVEPMPVVLLRIGSALNAACTVGAIAIMIWRLRRPAPPRDRTRLRALVLATLVALPIPAALTLAEAFRWYTPSDDLPRLAVAALLLGFPSIVGYAIVRRDLLEIDRAIARAAAISIVVGVVAIAFAGMAIVAPRLLAPTGSPTATAMAAIATIAVLWPIQRRVRDRLIAAFASQADIRPVVEVASRGDQLGDYKVERFLAAGGMGTIYVATKLGAAGFAKPVAIKQLLPEVALDPEAVERFLDEARVVARLSHPGIVQTLELARNDRGYFIVMEYVDGVDAATLIQRVKRQRVALPLAIASHIATSVCVALDHAHHARDDRGAPLHLVHHDVSPHNVLVDRDGNVKLADFGVAHVRRRPSDPERLVGKIGYIAPEQLRREPSDHRVDVFAAGIVLYELVTGQHPFAAGSDTLTLRAIAHGRYLPPEMLREDCPASLAQTIDRALASDPQRRFPTAAALAESIQTSFPLDSRNAAELGRIVANTRTVAAEVAAAATHTLPTARHQK
jgi:hypothetical protein